MSTLQAILLFIFSSISGIDSSCEEFQTHRPLIAGTLTGIALGNLKVGVMAGASMEFIALGWMTIGAAVPPDPALAGITIAILEILGKQNAGVAISIAIPLAVAGQFLQIIEKGTIDIALMHFAEIGVEKGKFSRVTTAHLLAAIPSALRVAIPALIIGYFADASLVQQLLNAIPKQITLGLQISSGFLVIVGYAMILNLLNVKELLPFFFIGFIIITFSDVTIFALTLIAISFAVIYYHITSLILKEDKRRIKKTEISNQISENSIKVSKKDLIKVFLRTQVFQISWNYERLQNLCYCFCIMPVLKKLYKKEEELKPAVMANMEYYNSHPFFVSIILGVNIAMEEVRARGEKLDERDIAQVKIALMGPLAGIGDPIFWGTIRPILAAIGAGISIKGDVSGAIIFFLSINVIRLFIRYNFLMFSYKKGVNTITNIKSFMPRLKNIMTVLAYTIIGGLVAKLTKINIIVTMYSYLKDGKFIKVTAQQQLDAIMPNLVPLIMTFIICWLLKKKVSPLVCMLILMILGIAGYSFGMLG
ncbi:PTS system mannose/fructose/sorbose family transporter subunit IID [Clostridium guangxiense]|uniref:PTS system mannose/fructose/sorbose family transporter subunit IID n=1 Tax=Clostridium guangxiense TaxID=1662055 RepID=UPI001E5F0470|nr:PTS system mannose/fructose/sorbose family transporter subunit IID [Clostridium guangxiense]MCD2348288.1 PTS system mannose/fructose/sorbose family transporter subunit IID [Clostridium guangxiense]